MYCYKSLSVFITGSSLLAHASFLLFACKCSPVIPSAHPPHIPSCLSSVLLLSYKQFYLHHLFSSSLSVVAFVPLPRTLLSYQFACLSQSGVPLIPHLHQTHNAPLTASKLLREQDQARGWGFRFKMDTLSLMVAFSRDSETRRRPHCTHWSHYIRRVLTWTCRCADKQHCG